MTTNDFDRTARLWLDDGPTELSDRALQAALDEIHVTRQRRVWWPARRFPSTINTIRLAAGVAALVLATVLGTSLLPGGGPGGPQPTPSPTPTPTPRPLTGPDTILAPGTFISGDPFLVRVTFTVPAGWVARIGGPYLLEVRKVGTFNVRVAFSLFEKVYADPCHYDLGLLDPRPGPTVEDLATALASLPGLDATTPTDVTVDGSAGKQLTLTAPASFDGCTLAPNGYAVWELPLGATYVMTPGQRGQVWILDVEGERLVIDVLDVPGETPQEQAEVQGILDSIRLAPLD